MSLTMRMHSHHCPALTAALATKMTGLQRGMPVVKDHTKQLIVKSEAVQRAMVRSKSTVTGTEDDGSASMSDSTAKMAKPPQAAKIPATFVKRSSRLETSVLANRHQAAVQTASEME